MFTGLIDNVGTIERVTSTDAGHELRIRCGYTDLSSGESLAVNGVCLTVRECGVQWFTAAAISTTLERTTFGACAVGDHVNLERALPANGRLGGHIVQGHVDGVGTVRDTRIEGDARLIDIEVPANLFELMVPQGSVTVDGVSLTVNEPAARQRAATIAGSNKYCCATQRLEHLASGRRVHLEADIIGKYVRRFTAPYTQVPA